MKVDKKVSVKFETLDTVDSRFTKVKIWLMHTGLNYNKSVFDKEVVEKAFPTLKNTPILAYIEESRSGEIDFAGHEMEIVVKDGEMKVRYLGKAVGVIPDDCNPRWEQREGDDGQLRDYLVVDGIVWNKFDEAVDILQEHGEVAQSMELDDIYDGSWDEEGNFRFTDFSFYGACLLGQGISPAMQKASVELYSKDDKVFKTIQEKMNEYKSLFNKKQEVEQVTLEELLAKYSTTVEALAEKGVDVSQFSVEDLEAKLAEVFAESDEGSEGEKPSTDMKTESSENEGSGEGEADGEGEGEDQELSQDDDGKGSGEGEGAPEKFTLNFELSHDDIRSKLYNGLDQHIANANGVQDDWSWNYIVAVYETHFITEDDYGQKFHMVGYSKDGDNIALGDVKEVFAMFLTSDEKGALDLMRSSFDQYEKENAELKEFKLNVLKEQHEVLANEIFAKFNKLTDDEVADIRENVHTFSLEEIESKLFERLGRKTANFTVAKPNQSYSMKIGVNVNSENPNPNSYAHLFKKHGLS